MSSFAAATESTGGGGVPGQVVVVVQRGEDLYNVEWAFQTQDPYVKFQPKWKGARLSRTCTIKDGGTNPVFTLPTSKKVFKYDPGTALAHGGELAIVLKVFDENTVTDKMIGWGPLDVSSIIAEKNSEPTEFTVPLSKEEGGDAGSLSVLAHFEELDVKDVWSKVEHEDGGFYYYNKISKTSSWTPPEGWPEEGKATRSPTATSSADEPKSWKEFIDDESGQKYWHNSVTHESQWTMPECLQELEREAAAAAAEEQDGKEQVYEDGEFTGDTVPLPGNDFHFHMNEWFDKEELENEAFEEGDYIALYRCEDLDDAMVSGNRWYQLTGAMAEAGEWVWEASRGVSEDDEDWEFRYFRSGGNKLVARSAWFQVGEGDHSDSEEANGESLLAVAVDVVHEVESDDIDAMENPSSNDDGTDDRAMHPIVLSIPLKVALDKIIRATDYREDISMESCWALVTEECDDGDIHSVLSETEKDLLTSTYQDNQEEFQNMLAQLSEEPFLLHASAGLQSCIEQAKLAVQKIVARFEDTGEKFTDKGFDPQSNEGSVLWVDKVQPGYDCTTSKPTRWVRLRDMVGEELVLFKDGVGSGDIIQGCNGTCWLLGAMGSVAGMDGNRLASIFVAHSVEAGVYAIRFCVDGEWRFLLIDDYLPVDNSGALLYAQSKDPAEGWCPLLEKAVGKLHTCFEMIDGGFASEAVHNFFGGVSGTFATTKKHRKKPASFFRAIFDAFSKGYVLSASFAVQEGDAKGEGKCGEDMLPCGLVGGHAYSVVGIGSAMGNRLIRFRNPWGQGEWTGKWSDKNTEGEWTPEMKDALSYVDENDGTFWMSVEDFVRNSPGIEYARIFGKGWKKTTQYGQILGSTDVKGIPAVAISEHKPSNDVELDLDIGDEVMVTYVDPGYWWYGVECEGGNDDFQLAFPAHCVQLPEQPVAGFVMEPLGGSKDNTIFSEGINVVVLLTQQNKMLQRNFFFMNDVQLNYKDTRYHEVSLYIVDEDSEDGTVVLKKNGAKRCMWGEIHLIPGHRYKVYAMSMGGIKFSLRAYVKDGSLSIKENKDATLQDILDIRSRCP
jgi:hypothetical protein